MPLVFSVNVCVFLWTTVRQGQQQRPDPLPALYFVPYGCPVSVFFPFYTHIHAHARRNIFFFVPRSGDVLVKKYSRSNTYRSERRWFFFFGTLLECRFLHVFLRPQQGSHPSSPPFHLHLHFSGLLQSHPFCGTPRPAYAYKSVMSVPPNAFVLSI